MPQAAVTCGGQVRVNSGSTIAQTGVKLSCRSDFLKPCFPTLLMTAFFVASLPVPAVVGTAMKGKVLPGCVFGRYAFQIRRDGFFQRQHGGNGLGTVDDASASNRDDCLYRQRGELLHSVIHGFRRGFSAETVAMDSERGFYQRLLTPLPVACPIQRVPAGDHQHLCGMRGYDLTEFFHSARSKNQLWGSVEVKSLDHHGESQSLTDKSPDKALPF